MTLIFYNWVMWALQPFLRRKLKHRGQNEPGYLLSVEERFGYYDQPAGDGFVWIHAVSLGETRAAAVLLQALRLAHPEIRILLTHGTATGREQGVSLLREGDIQVWQPWDTVSSVRRFLSHFKPRLGVILETELWPNWVSQCQAFQIPLVLVNARMSEKSKRQAQRLSWLSRPAYEGLSAVFAQTEDDAKRLRALGAQVKSVMGNLKFDAKPDAQQLAQALVWKAKFKRPVILFSSSREGEEVMWLDALQAHATDGVQWLIVPRHPQRFDEVVSLMSQRGWIVSRRSDWLDGPESKDFQSDVRTIWVGDSLGEMALYYGLSDVTLLGGSFAPLGGQNLIEATACGCPVIMGPHTFNFSEAAQLAEQAGAAVRVTDMSHAVTKALSMVLSRSNENSYVQACFEFSQTHRGAAYRTVTALEPYLNNLRL